MIESLKYALYDKYIAVVYTEKADMSILNWVLKLIINIWNWQSEDRFLS